MLSLRNDHEVPVAYACWAPQRKTDGSIVQRGAAGAGQRRLFVEGAASFPRFLDVVPRSSCTRSESARPLRPA